MRRNGIINIFIDIAVTKYCDFLVSFLQRIMDNGRFHSADVGGRRCMVSLEPTPRKVQTCEGGCPVIG